MSKLLRLPLTLIAVLAALFFLPGIAWGDPLTPSPAECTATPDLTGCPAPAGGDVASGGTSTDQPKDTPPAAPPGEQPSGNAPVTGLVIPAFQLPAAPAGPVVGLDAVTDPPPDLCTTFPNAPICDVGGGTPPTIPLTCDGLAQVLGLPAGCPSSFSCEDLADLLGLTCPAGPPSCQALAELFHLQGCPQPPTSCQEFADLLGVDNCSQIPCLDTSQLPASARAGLQPLFDGLENIGIKECPAKPVPTTPGKGTYMPQPAVQQQQTPYYANCDDARAKGKAPVYSTDPGYRPELDSDHDGIGCEVDAQPVAAVQQPTGRLAYTGTEFAPQLKVAWTLLMLGTGLLILGRRRA